MSLPKILFAGTPQIAVPLLKALSERFDVVGVLTATDKPQGRSKEPVPSDVKVAALELGLPVLQFDSLKKEAREAVRSTGANVLVTFAYGKIFGPMFLALFNLGTFNVHPSDLPLLRGASPIQHTILNKMRNCVISLQNVGEKMDEGDIWASIPVETDGRETTLTLTDKIALKAAETIPEILDKALNSEIKPRPQVGEATYCSVIEKSEAILNFNLDTATLHAKIRAMYPWPKAVCKADGKDIMITGVWGGYNDIYCEERPNLPNGTVCAVRKDRGIGVVCSDGILWITSLQLPGKKELDFKSFINGNRWIEQAVLS